MRIASFFALVAMTTSVVECIGMIIPPILKAHTRFSSTSSSLSYYLNEYRTDDHGYKEVVEEYFNTVPCLRTPLDSSQGELFVIIRMKFPNVEENNYNSKGQKNQIFNLNIIHRNLGGGHDQEVDIIRNKRDITEGDLRLGFKVPLLATSRHGGYISNKREQSASHSHELDICFENILIDRSKLLKSVKTDEGEQFISREVEIEISKFANYDEFQKLYNNYEKEAIEELENKEAELQKLDALVQSITDELNLIEQEEIIKRDFNEKVFSNTLNFQIAVMVSILVFNAVYMYRLQRHLRKKLKL